MDKAQVRSQMKQTLLRVSEAQFRPLSYAACQNVRLHPAYLQASTILCYAALPYEADPAALAEYARLDGKRVAYPYCLNKYEMLALEPVGTDAWETGAYGIRTPRPDCSRAVDAGEIDLVLVPGLAFDLRGGRLGRGAGYYDRYLRKTGAFRMGFCLDIQIIEQVPMDEYDMPMQALISNSVCYLSIC